MPISIIFRIVGMVSALNIMAGPKEIHILASSAPSYCGYAVIWQAPRFKKYRLGAVRFRRCLPTIRRQRYRSGWCGGTAGCSAPAASRAPPNTAAAGDTSSDTHAGTVAGRSTARSAPSCTTAYRHLKPGGGAVAIHVWSAQWRLHKAHPPVYGTFLKPHTI